MSDQEPIKQSKNQISRREFLKGLASGGAALLSQKFPGELAQIKKSENAPSVEEITPIEDLTEHMLDLKESDSFLEKVNFVKEISKPQFLGRLLETGALKNFEVTTNTPGSTETGPPMLSILSPSWLPPENWGDPNEKRIGFLPNEPKEPNIPGKYYIETNGEPPGLWAEYLANLPYKEIDDWENATVRRYELETKQLSEMVSGISEAQDASQILGVYLGANQRFDFYAKRENCSIEGLKGYEKLQEMQEPGLLELTRNEEYVEGTQEYIFKRGKLSGHNEPEAIDCWMGFSLSIDRTEYWNGIGYIVQGFAETKAVFYEGESKAGASLYAPYVARPIVEFKDNSGNKQLNGEWKNYSQLAYAVVLTNLSALRDGQDFVDRERA